jgi:flavin-dependent dehydrogenase
MASRASHRFAKLRASSAGLSDAQLLNSNNLTSFTGHSDVVVAGAGIIGLCYAVQLKTTSPHLNIALFEKSDAPVQKIGKSTLSSFSRFTNGHHGPSRLHVPPFGMKDGLQFYCLDEEGRQVTCENVGGLDFSFQLDRRISELFFTMWAQSIGIHVYHGVGVDFEIEGQEISPSKLFSPPQVKLANFPVSGVTQVDTRLVCDALGFSRRLTSKFGKKEQFAGWNCDAYWAYFKYKGDNKAESRLDHWDWPATKHMCMSALKVTSETAEL